MYEIWEGTLQRGNQVLISKKLKNVEVKNRRGELGRVFNDILHWEKGLRAQGTVGLFQDEKMSHNWGFP